MRSQKYPALKESNFEHIGAVPSSWDVSKRLRHIFQVKKGRNPVVQYDSEIDSSLPYLTASYLRGGELEIWVPNDGLKAEEGDILLLWDGSNAGEFFKSREGIVSSTFSLLSTSEQNKQFFWYALKSCESYIKESSIGMGIPHVNGDALRNLKIATPSPLEQDRIANFLDIETVKIDGLIKKQEELIALLHEKIHIAAIEIVTQGLNQHNFKSISNVFWINKIPSHWVVERIKTIFEIKKRIAGKLGYDVLSITQNGIKVKDTENNDGQQSMDYSKYQIVEKGDFAMNHMDLLTGYVDIANQDGVTSPDYRVFSIRNQSKYYPEYYLLLLQLCYKSKLFYPFGQGSSQLGRWRLPTDAFNQFYYPVPPYEEQVEIANVVLAQNNKIALLIEKSRRSIELLKEHRASLIYAAVTGKIMVAS